MHIIDRLLKTVAAVRPVDLNTGVNAGDYISLKNVMQAAVSISIGVTTGTCVVILNQAKNVAASGAKALTFLKYWMSGTKLKYTSPTGKFTVGEVIQGAGGARGTVYQDFGSYLLMYTVNATPFVTGETLTGATSAVTATADGIGIDEDVMLSVTCASTFTIPAVSNKKYWIEIDPASLDVDNGFDCVSVYLAQASQGCIGSVDYIVEPKHPSTPTPTAIYD